MEQLNGITLDRREMINLGYTGGVAHRYKNYNIPKKISRPVVYKPTGGVPAFYSNGRSALVKCDDRWFKLKGINPKPNETYKESGEPFGGMSEKKATRELEANELIEKGFGKYGYEGPLTPVGYFEYNKPFNGGKVCCAISQSRGDTRVYKIFGSNFFRALQERDKAFIDFYSNIIEWIGFSDRILKEQRVSIPRHSCVPGNFVIYKQEEGYGIGPVDLSSSELGVGDRSIFVHLTQFFNFEESFGSGFSKKMEKRYLDALNGFVVPEPINEKTVRHFVG